MKILNVEVTRSHALMFILAGLFISGILMVIRHPLVDPVKSQVLFSFFSGTFVPVLIEWLRETPTIRRRFA